MTTLREAAELAMEAMEHIMNYSSPHGLAAITSTLRKALAQPEQERDLVRKPLTDEAMRALWESHGYKSALCMRFARAIERAHGIGGKE